MRKKQDGQKRRGESVRGSYGVKRKNFTDEVYGARLSHEDARIIDDYGKENKLDRSEVVRLGLHQFALRQQMRYHKKNPLREMTEQVVAAQIAPLYHRAEETAAVLRQLAELVTQTRRAPATVPEDGKGSAQKIAPPGEMERPQPQHLQEQKRLLEKTLMAAMLALRLHVNYVVEPALQNGEARAAGSVSTHLSNAIKGREGWNETTREIVSRTGNRILFELNLISREDWEALLKTYE